MSNCLRLSASCINCFKACKMRFFYQYVLGLQKKEDSDAQRIGNAWHACREIITRIQAGETKCWKKHSPKYRCMVCDDTGELPSDPMAGVTQFLNNYYDRMSEYADAQKMRVERATILYAMAGYEWYYSENRPQPIASEFKAEFPVWDPYREQPVKNAVVVFICDGLIMYDGRPAIREYKSTSSSLGDDSTYWQNLNMAFQPNLYVHSTSMAQRTGQLAALGITPDMPLIRDVLYDVFHKPQSKPKKLSFKDTKTFLETGMYCDSMFPWAGELASALKDFDCQGQFLYEGEPIIIEPGKKEGDLAIRETAEMYGARLLQEIGQSPEKYFARRLLTKGDADVARTEKEIYHIYRNMQTMIRQGSWYHEEESCEATFKCDFMPLCYNNVDVEGELAAGRVPEGFRVFQSNSPK